MFNGRNIVGSMVGVWLLAPWVGEGVAGEPISVSVPISAMGKEAAGWARWQAGWAECQPRSIGSVWPD